jgi:hypothetical protein
MHSEPGSINDSDLVEGRPSPASQQATQAAPLTLWTRLQTGDDEEERESVPVGPALLAPAAVPSRCTKCKVALGDDWAEHFKSAWHLHNLRRALGRRAPLSQAEFSEMFRKAEADAGEDPICMNNPDGIVLQPSRALRAVFVSWLGFVEDSGRKGRAGEEEEEEESEGEGEGEEDDDEARPEVTSESAQITVYRGAYRFSVS